MGQGQGLLVLGRVVVEMADTSLGRLGRYSFHQRRFLPLLLISLVLGTGSRMLVGQGGALEVDTAAKD